VLSLATATGGRWIAGPSSGSVLLWRCRPDLPLAAQLWLDPGGACPANHNLTETGFEWPDLMWYTAKR